MLPISVIFTTYNEAHNIELAFQSVADWAAEIIVTDSFSTDETVQIIKNFKQKTKTEIRLFERKYEGPSDQKNWTIPHAKHHFALLMDADERVTPAMQREIEAILTNESNADLPKFDGYWIGFTHFFMGKQVRYSGWQNDKTIRLIRTDRCRYNANKVHEEIDHSNLSIGKLENKFDHFTFKNLQHFVEKQMRYARWSAEDHADRTPRVTGFHLVVKPFFRFFKHFVLKKGFLDGKVGFFIAATAAWTVFLRYAHIVENRQKKEL